MELPKIVFTRLFEEFIAVRIETTPDPELCLFEQTSKIVCFSTGRVDKTWKKVSDLSPTTGHLVK